MKTAQTLLIFFLLVFVSACKKENSTPTPVPAIAISPQPEAAFAVSTCFLKQGESVQFNNSSLHAENYLWDFGDGETSELVSPLHSYKTKGIYRVKLLTRNGEKTQEADTTIYYGMKAYVEVKFSIPTWNPWGPNMASLFHFSIDLNYMNDTANKLNYVCAETVQYMNDKLNVTKKVPLAGESFNYKIKCTITNDDICGYATYPPEYFVPIYSEPFPFLNSKKLSETKRFNRFVLVYDISETRFE